ncbi:MAG: MATE family efflux transporter, partial [Clostridia bacterium]|nr:MATE family efflux transporter [Clostridia bacterium]
PILLGKLMQQFYNLADAAIVGKFVGTGALAAVGATGSILFLVIGFVDGMCAGLCIPIARSFGADDQPLLRRCLAHAVYLAVFFAILLTAVTSLLLEWLLTVMNTPADIFRDAFAYLRIIFLGIPATIFYNLTAGLLRALGNSRTPLVFLIFASCMNIVLDLVLVLVFHLDVPGVGIATVTSQLFAAAGCFLYIRKHYPMLRMSRNEMAFDKKITWRMLLSGLPMALQYSITAIGSVLIQVSINNLGSLLVASVTAGLKIHQIALLPINTLGAAMATWSGQNIGAANPGRVREGVVCGMKIQIVYSVVMGLLLFFFGKNMTLLLLDPADPNLPFLQENAQAFIRANCSFYILLGTLTVLRFTLQGLEYGPLAMFAGIFELAARSIIAFFGAPLWGFDIIRFANPAAWAAACILLIPAYCAVMRKFRIQN